MPLATSQEERIYLEGPVAISRSPTMHPGDVQVARAVGEIPEGWAPHISLLKNCVVFSSKGSRSLPSCLGGGDLEASLSFKPLLELILSCWAILMATFI